MAIPDYESIMRPMLSLLADGKVQTLGEIADKLVDEFSLTEEEQKQLLPSGLTSVFRSRVGWAKTYLKQAGLISQPKRGVVQINQRGLDAIKSTKAINNKFLENYQEFIEFRTRSKQGTDTTQSAKSESIEFEKNISPEEQIETSFALLRQAVFLEIAEALSQCSPSKFEEVVIALLIKMGYGGSRAEAGRAVGRSGDGGIDGVISEDRLGLDTIYVQAKRWQGTVGESEIRNFLGALVGRGATKGVFLTTGQFSEKAQSFSMKSIQQRIILIDGQRLAELMLEHNLGVSNTAVYEIKRLDSDFFTEE